MKRFLALILGALSLNVFALEFDVAPYMNYNVLKDKFSDDSGINLSVKRTGFLAGISGAVESPIFRVTVINNLQANAGYGLVDSIFVDKDANKSDPDKMNMKVWKMSLEDTITYYSKVSSRTAPYFGAGYVYDKYELNPVPSLLEGLVIVNKGVNKRFYVPIGFKVKATNSFLLDIRYEKDLLAKLNKSSVYLEPFDPDKLRKFKSGHGYVLNLKWNFSPRQNTAISLKYIHHAVKFEGDLKVANDLSLQQKQAEDSILVQLHWLGNV